MEEVKITYDVPFKGTFASNDELLKLLIKSLLDIDIHDITYKNTFTIPKDIKNKKLILDLRFNDDNGILYNLEMQNYHINRGQLNRFYIYSYQTYDTQVMVGRKYNHYQNAYTIVFTNTKSDRLIDILEIYRNGEKTDELSSGHIYLIHYPYIKEILKDKSIEELNALEIMCYIFNYGFDNDIMGLERKEVAIMYASYRYYNDNDEERELALSIERGEMFVESVREDARIEGKEEGKAERLEEINKLIQCLSRDNRIDDLIRSAHDALFQKQLMIEYGIV